MADEVGSHMGDGAVRLLGTNLWTDGRGTVGGRRLVGGVGGDGVTDGCGIAGDGR